MEKLLKEGQLFPEELLKEIRDKFYYINYDPATETCRLYFDNSGGSYRLKAASNSFKKADELPDCFGHEAGAAAHLLAHHKKAARDIMTMFNASTGSLTLSLAASRIIYEITEIIVENIPGTNVVTSELEHPSAYDPCVVYAKKFGKELRVAKANPETGTIDPGEVIKLVDKNTTLLSIIATSNITGAVIDIETIVRECRKKNPDLYIICDSVQHIPHHAFDLEKCPVDAVSFAPYKLGGVRGIGVGWISPRVAKLPHQCLIGAEDSNWELGGTASGHFAQISAIFDNICWIGSKFIDSTDSRELYCEGMYRIGLHERALLYRMLNGSDKAPGLRQIDGVKVYADTDDLHLRCLIVPLIFENLAPDQPTVEYEKEGIIIHERLDSSLYSVRQLHAVGLTGIARISPFYCNSAEEIDKFLLATAKIAKIK